MNEEKEETTQLNTRVSRCIAKELRQCVVKKHGKLFGSLRTEIETAIKNHIESLKIQTD